MGGSHRRDGLAAVVLVGGVLLLAAAGPDRAVGDCTECHESGGAGDHPTGIVPSMRVPGDLPLIHGRIACTTCHEADAAATHAEVPATGDPRLRGDARALCVRCHDTGNVGRSSIHALVLDRAHLPANERTGTSPGGNERTGTALGTALANEWTSTSLGMGARAGGIDAVSVGCLSCHDGSLAADGARDADASPFPGLGHGHPVGVKYGRRGGRLGETALHPAWGVDRRIRLFDGTVGCGSCHSLYSPEPALLVMPNDRSELCLSCHDV